MAGETVRNRILFSVFDSSRRRWKAGRPIQVPQRPPRPPLTAPGRWVGAMDVEPSHHPPAPAQLRRTLSSRTHRSDIGTWAETPRAGGGGPQRTTSMPRPGHFRLRDQPGYHAVPTGTLRGPGVQRPHSMLLKSASPMPGVRGGAHDVTSPAWQADSDVAGRVPYVSPIRSLPVSHSRSSLPAMRCTTRPRAAAVCGASSEEGVRSPLYRKE